MTEGSVRIGIDLGGTKTEIIALDMQGEELLRRRVATPSEDYAAILAAIVSLVRDTEGALDCLQRFRRERNWGFAHVLSVLL